MRAILVGFSNHKRVAFVDILAGTYGTLFCLLFVYIFNANVVFLFCISGQLCNIAF